MDSEYSSVPSVAEAPPCRDPSRPDSAAWLLLDARGEVLGLCLCHETFDDESPDGIGFDFTGYSVGSDGRMHEADGGRYWGQPSCEDTEFPKNCGISFAAMLPLPAQMAECLVENAEELTD